MKYRKASIASLIIDSSCISTLLLQ